MMFEEHTAMKYYEPAKPVTSRSGDECVVALCDSGSLKYGEATWKERVERHLKVVETFFPGIRHGFEETLNWLADWPCSRTFWARHGVAVCRRPRRDHRLAERQHNLHGLLHDCPLPARRGGQQSEFASNKAQQVRHQARDDGRRRTLGLQSSVVKALRNPCKPRQGCLPPWPPRCARSSRIGTP